MQDVLTNYCFFVQPQINVEADTVFGYEVLLRKNIAGQWRVPEDFTELSIDEQLELLEQTISQIKNPEELVFSFNLNAEQAQDPPTLEKVIEFRRKIAPVPFVVEFTEAVSLDLVKEYSRQLHQNNTLLAIDDVGTGSNTFDNIKAYIPFIDKIKFAMQNFRMANEPEAIAESLKFWVNLAKKHDLLMVLEGIESSADQLCGAKLGIDLQQGYLYGKPMKP